MEEQLIETGIPSMDRLKAMNAFVRAVDLGSLSAAARELHTT